VVQAFGGGGRAQKRARDVPPAQPAQQVGTATDPDTLSWLLVLPITRKLTIQGGSGGTGNEIAAVVPGSNGGWSWCQVHSVLVLGCRCTPPLHMDALGSTQSGLGHSAEVAWMFVACWMLPVRLPCAGTCPALCGCHGAGTCPCPVRLPCAGTCPALCGCPGAGTCPCPVRLPWCWDVPLPCAAAWCWDVPCPVPCAGTCPCLCGCPVLGRAPALCGCPGAGTCPCPVRLPWCWDVPLPCAAAWCWDVPLPCAAAWCWDVPLPCAAALCWDVPLPCAAAWCWDVPLPCAAALVLGRAPALCGCLLLGRAPALCGCLVLGGCSSSGVLLPGANPSIEVIAALQLPVSTLLLPCSGSRRTFCAGPCPSPGGAGGAAANDGGRAVLVWSSLSLGDCSVRNTCYDGACCPAPLLPTPHAAPTEACPRPLLQQRPPSLRMAPWHPRQGGPPTCEEQVPPPPSALHQVLNGEALLVILFLAYWFHGWFAPCWLKFPLSTSTSVQWRGISGFHHRVQGLGYCSGSMRCPGTESRSSCTELRCSM